MRSSVIAALMTFAMIIAPLCARAQNADPQPSNGEEFDDCGGAGWCPTMVVIPAGSFTMGSPLWEYGRQENEGPRRSVSVRQFAAGKFELTFAQWSACVDRGGCVRDAVDRDSGAGRRNYPVRNVSWHDVQQYVRWLSVETGEEYRLLSEAEWEYAARAGTTTTYSTGAWIRHSQANFGGSIGPQPVGSYAANAFGLYDMHGNMWEWVQDCYRDSYRGLPTDGSAHDQTACTLRVSRGGSWGNGPRVLRSAIRLERRPDGRSDLFGGILGVRVARTLP